MRSQRSNEAETQTASRVEHLLGLLREHSQRDPSPALRARLSELASQRLRERRASMEKSRKRLAWLVPALAIPLLIVLVSSAVISIHLRQKEFRRATDAVQVNRPAPPPTNEMHVTAPIRPHKLPHRTKQILPSGQSPLTGQQQMTMRLPYSNGAIETGTGATIRVSMSQSELFSLGFPVSATLRDRRIVAQLTLGDDGLPRAISLPLPLEFVKEEK